MPAPIDSDRCKLSSTSTLDVAELNNEFVRSSKIVLYDLIKAWLYVIIACVYSSTVWFENLLLLFRC